MKWKVFPILWMSLKRTCTFLGALLLISTIISIWSLSSVPLPDTHMPNQMVLYMELDGGLDDLPEEVSLLDPFSAQAFTIKDFIDGLNSAAEDDRVEGVYAKLRNGSYSIAHIQEIRQAIENFRDSGKFAYIYSNSYGDVGGLGSYYLASSFDEIWMQPMGVVAVTGVSAEMPFLRDVLDKVGIEPNFFHRKDYKTAYESFTNSEISPANKEMTTRMIGNIASVLQNDISEDRGLEPEQFKTLVDRGLFIAPEAKAAGLVDVVDYDDKLVRKINEYVTGDPEGEDLEYVHFNNYIQSLKSASAALPMSSKKPGVALIYAVGVIIDTDDNLAHASGVNMANDGTAAADDIAEALYEASDDPDINSIVLRVNSPGGSPVASETILRAIELAKEKGKTVYVSMGPVAASGGYWIAAYADRIFALPTTLTGSIGVLGGKVSLKGLWEKIGVNWERISWGKNAAMWSANDKFDEHGAERMNAMLDNIYDNFLIRVSKGRNMDVKDVDKIAGGRVWTGKTALEIGLVDELGSLDDTLDYAARELGRLDRNDVNIHVLPKPLTPFEQFIALLEGQITAGQTINALARTIQAYAPDVNALAASIQPNQYSIYNDVQVK